MKCRACQDKLTNYRLGEMQEPERKLVEAHLRACPDCAEHLTELDLLDGLLEPVAAQEPRRDLWPALAERLETEQAQRQARRAVQRRVWVPAGALATAAAAAGIVLLVSSQPQTPVTVPTNLLPGLDTVAESTVLWDDPWAGDTARALDWVLSNGA